MNILSAVKYFMGRSIRKISLSGNRSADFRFADLESLKFNEWFNGSQVVDCDGDPLTLYHGTTTLIRHFSPLTHFSTRRAADVGVWRARRAFQSAIDVSSFHRYYLYDHDDVIPDGHSAGHHYSVVLRITNPLRVSDISDDHTPLAFAKLAGSLFSMREVATIEAAQESFGNGLWSPARYLLAIILSEHGYDGFCYSMHFEDVGATAWVPILPSQVRVCLTTCSVGDSSK